MDQRDQEISEHLLEIYTRLNFYEFLLEIYHSNLFRMMPNGQAELAQFRQDVHDLIQKGQHEGGPTPLDARTIARMGQIAERFFQKVEDRMG